uniref:Toxin candidate TRINITY_DN4281_c0_g1_i1 n=1 Tax=Ceriantheomorphe brasiliensis TaxID=1048506 RepID=A0A7G7WZ73_9CNID|nr:toxin candidate TRINITY_DN4281_c0_g1_i1 [Ceriantheomorphe brasiliensis]
MEIWIVVSVVFSYICTAIIAKGDMIANEYCMPRPTLVDIDRPTYNFFPYVVKLNRCGGSCNSIAPNIKHCVPTSSTDIKITVFSPITGGTHTIVQKNHTACGCQCVAKATDCDPDTQTWKPDHCRCECKYKEPPVPCPAGSKWDSGKCKCVCSTVPEKCSNKKVWSTETCGCVCHQRHYNRCARKGKMVDETDCGCISMSAAVIGNKDDSNSGISKEYLVVVLAVQFGVLFMVFDCILYTKQAGVIYTLKKKCSSKNSAFNSTDSESSCDPASGSQHGTWESTENIVESELPPGTNTLPRSEA